VQDANALCCLLTILARVLTHGDVARGPAGLRTCALALRALLKWESMPSVQVCVLKRLKLRLGRCCDCHQGVQIAGGPGGTFNLRTLHGIVGLALCTFSCKSLPQAEAFNLMSNVHLLEQAPRR
jgi:hypothetical protein